MIGDELLAECFQATYQKKVAEFIQKKRRSRGETYLNHLKQANDNGGQPATIPHFLKNYQAALTGRSDGFIQSPGVPAKQTAPSSSSIPPAQTAPQKQMDPTQAGIMSTLSDMPEVMHAYQDPRFRARYHNPKALK
jgi:hypothetical protein